MKIYKTSDIIKTPNGDFEIKVVELGHERLKRNGIDYICNVDLSNKIIYIADIAHGIDLGYIICDFLKCEYYEKPIEV